MSEILLKDGRRLVIQPACTQDAQALLDFLETVTGETEMLAAGPGEMGLGLPEEEAFIERVASTPNAVLLQGSAEGEVVSVASLEPGARPRARHTAELGISVKKAFWGQGVGAAMMEALLNWATENSSLSHIHLGLRVDNKTAFRLYRRYGFTACGIRRKFLRVGQRYYDELLMEKILEGPLGEPNSQ